MAHQCAHLPSAIPFSNITHSILAYHLTLRSTLPARSQLFPLLAIFLEFVIAEK
ncbi:hypothetical protein SAMN05216316_1568 [Nitrosovibrio sp. Nv6]|nr:hypothetical protein SAMN05216316_1568 [Nitrosovibrio sp. Nv6]